MPSRPPPLDAPTERDAAATKPVVAAAAAVVHHENLSCPTNHQHSSSSSSSWKPDPSIAGHTLSLFFSGNVAQATDLLQSSPPHAIDFALLCLPSALAVAGSSWLLLRTRRAWRRRQFESTINFSLTSFRQWDVNMMVKEHTNVLVPRFMDLRTLKETELDQCMHNQGVDALLKATARCSSTLQEAKLVEMPKAEADVVKNKLLNEISSQFAQGFLARDLLALSNNNNNHAARQQVVCSTYGFAMTCGRGNLGDHKIRVVLASMATLQEAARLQRLCVNPAVLFEHPQRFEHLLLMHQALVDKEEEEQVRDEEKGNNVDAGAVDSRPTDPNAPGHAGSGPLEKNGTMFPIVGKLELCVHC